MKKIIISFLLLLCILFSSCGFIIVGSDETAETAKETEKRVDTSSETEIDTESGSESVTENAEEPESAADRAKKRVNDLADFDFSKQSFIIATTNEMTFATDGDNYYDRVLLLRDSIVEEKYNVDIITVSVAESRIETELRNASLAEEYYADLISVPEYRIGRLASEGLIMNLRSLPFYGTTDTYSRNSDAAYAGSAIYADIGAASSDFSKIYAVFFNRSAAESMGYDLDAMVEDNEWTWDTFDKLARQANEQFGMVGQGSYAMGNEYTDVVFRSGNVSLVDNSLGKTPEISFDSPRLESLIELCCALIYGNDSAYKPAAGASENDFYSLFGSGQLLFAVAPLSAMQRLATVTVDWGVLPIPKYDEAQDGYYAYTEASANVVAVPSENNKYEMTGVIIGALNTASYELLSEEYKVNCLYNYFRSIKAMRSMDAVLSSMTFDFTYLYSSAADLLANATHGAVREARTSTSDYATDLINRRKEAANAQLAELYGAKSFPEETLPEPPETDETVITEETDFSETDTENVTDTEAVTETTENE